MAEMNNMEEEVLRNIRLKGFHDGFFGVTPETPAQEEPTGGEELDCAAEALNWFKMGQIVGIIVMGAESDDDTGEDEPTEDQTPTSAEGAERHREIPSQQQPYPEKYNNPPEGTFTFAASREDIQRLNDLVGDLTDPNNEPDQTRGRVRDICDLALKLGADRLVNVCEAFTEGDATRAEVAATASEVLTYLAAETRRVELTEAFQEFCKSNGTNPKEMAEYIC